ncbi:MAG TPA: ElyC/SanA/YdcF family protein [Burkholderiaceae bacterium]|nr:ElyC/SanA/YdcF family protein [Burkholderiaceae bacterium]
MLFRRREVWLPTWQGTLLLLALLALAVVAAGRGAYGFLAPEAPAQGADGRGARTLVVEGWLDASELAQAAAAFRRGRYERVLTTGGPIDAGLDPAGWKTYAQRAAVVLRANGLDAVPVIALPAPPGSRDRTYRSALEVRAWAARSGTVLDAVDVYSAGVHARRSRLLFREALGRRVEVGVLAALPEGGDAQRWWTSSEATKLTLGEGLSLAWTLCCFWPGPPP